MKGHFDNPDSFHAKRPMPSPTRALHSPTASILFAHNFRLLASKTLNARDQFHVHLSHKANVFSTPDRPYLIRTSDPDSPRDVRHAGSAKRKAYAPPRTLLNSASNNAV
jgi:hypothetical protein